MVGASTVPIPAPITPNGGNIPNPVMRIQLKTTFNTALSMFNFKANFGSPAA
jgi:hypothetical protein